MVRIGVVCGLLPLACATVAAVHVSGTAIERRVKRTTISNGLSKRDTDPALLFPAHNLSVPIDHFHNDTLYEPHSNATFNLRYWFDATYYKPGGPVIVLQSGETSGTDRLPFLQKGLLHEMAVATNGIGVVLEHRYYGTSFPVPNLSTKNMRFLTTDQALADMAYFAQNVIFKGLEHSDLTSKTTAYIGYGGSYAGAFVAFLRKLYPEVYWGTISSSGVVEAIWDYWAYYEPIRVFANQSCISATQKLTHMVDNILIGINNTKTTAELKGVFGLPNVTHDDDFASVLTSGISSWQGKNWDPALNDPSFELYCANVSAPTLLWPDTQSKTATVQKLLKKGGYGAEVSSLTTPVLNWIGWLTDYEISSCGDPNQDTCFSTHNITFYEQDDIRQDWRSWPYQYCHQWGYLQTGSGVPKDQLPLVSRTSTLEYQSLICKYAFNITAPPNITAINKYGGFNISYPRLAMIDGEHDPWRPATAHASPFNNTAVNRTDSISSPYKLIPGAVHHWDENGLFANQTVDTPPNLLPPVTVRKIQAQEIQFVQAWMLEWEQYQIDLSARELRMQ